MRETKKITDGTKSATWAFGTLPTRLTILALVVGIGLLLVAILKAATWKQLNQLENEFAARRTELFYLGIQLQSVFERANQELLRAQLSKTRPEGALQFNERLAIARSTLARNHGALRTQREAECARQLAAALDEYQAQAHTLLERELKAVRKDSAAQVAGQIEQLSAPLLHTCQELIQAQRAAWIDFLHGTEQAASRLQVMAMLSVALQVLLVGVIAALIHRAWIEPLQSRLRASHERLERQEKLASLGTLTAGVAHEIRNPLTAIKFRLFSLKKALPPEMRDHEDLQVIGSEVNRLERIARDFLQFARPSEPELALVTTTQLLQDLRQIMAAQLEKRGVALRLDDSMEAMLRADRQQILQVLINLTQNAAESIDQSGTITWRISRRSARQEGNAAAMIALEVTDTGRGIPPEVQQRLFDPFFSTRAEGTGLGLCIAERIVSKHGGLLEYQTSPNQGTTFSVVLPQGEAHESKHTHR